MKLNDIEIIKNGGMKALDLFLVLLERNELLEEKLRATKLFIEQNHDGKTELFINKQPIHHYSIDEIKRAQSNDWIDSLKTGDLVKLGDVQYSFMGKNEDGYELYSRSTKLTRWQMEKWCSPVKS